MALKVKVAFVSQDKSGRRITLRDVTGFESSGSPDGYGPTNKENSDILSYIFSFSRIDSTDIQSFILDESDLELPSIEQASEGANIDVYSSFFNPNEDVTSLMFRDGVVDINMYVRFVGLTGIVATAGVNFITGGDFTSVLEADAVYVNGQVYNIDKLNSTSGMLYLDKDLLSNSTSFDLLYRSNIKALLLSVGDNLHQYATKKMVCSECAADWTRINMGLAYKEAAVLFFGDNPQDYSSANKLAVKRFYLLQRYMS